MFLILVYTKSMMYDCTICSLNSYINIDLHPMKNDFSNRNCIFSDVTVSLGTPKSCFFIGDNVKLLCVVSSESNCCGSSRFWQDNSGTNILNNGIPSDPSKYEEDYDNGNTGYNLIIKNVQKSDLGLNYKCLYRLKEDILFLSMDYICKCYTKKRKKDYIFKSNNNVSHVALKFDFNLQYFIDMIGRKY